MIDRAGILESLIRIIQEDTTVDVSSIDDAADLRGGLGLDSVDFVGLIMRIEGEYRIRFTRDELEKLENVGDILTLVQQKITATTPDAAAAAA